MHTVVGESDLLAIEFELEEPQDARWMFGRFRLRALGQVIGDADDVVTLRAVANWWHTFVATSVIRWDRQLEGLAAEEVFRILRDVVYGDIADDGLDNVFARYHINQLGMSAFDPYVVLLVEPPGQRQWLLWRREDSADSVHEAWLPAGTLQAVGAEFVSTLRQLARGEG